MLHTRVDILYNQLSGRKLLNGIEVLRKLGLGQYGKVILGRDLAADRLVAVKEILRRPKTKILKRNGTTPSSDALPERIQDELDAMHACDNLSPYVIKLFSVFNDTRYPNIYLVLEYCASGEVAWLDLGTSTCRNLTDALRLAADIALGLEFLQLRGVIHRDIKPSNLLIDASGAVKISDFGSSYVVDKKLPLEAQQKPLNRTVGTPMFLAPELCIIRGGASNGSTDSITDSIVNASGQKEEEEPSEPPLLDYKLDMWSYGVTLYCLLFNSLPFAADNEYELYKKITSEEIQYPSSSSLIHTKHDATLFTIFVDFLRSFVLVRDCAARADIFRAKAHELFNYLSDVTTFRTANDRFVSKTGLGLASLRISLLRTLESVSSKTASVRSAERIPASTSSNSIGRSSTASSGSKGMGGLRKTFSKLRLLRSTSGSEGGRSRQASGEMASLASKRSVSSGASAPELKEPEFEKPSFTKLLRKKSSQLLLGKPKLPFRSTRKASVEELGSPIRFRYAKSEKAGSKLASTVKLVDANDRLRTPEPYQTEETVDGSESEKMVQPLNSRNESVSELSLGSFESREQPGQLQNFFNKFTPATGSRASVKTSSTDTFGEYTENEDDGFEDEEEETQNNEQINNTLDTSYSYGKLVPSAKTYNLNRYVYKPDLYDDESSEEEDHDVTHEEPVRKSFSNLLQMGESKELLEIQGSLLNEDEDFEFTEEFDEGEFRSPQFSQVSQKYINEGKGHGVASMDDYMRSLA